jgi:hypothetical protein
LAKNNTLEKAKAEMDTASKAAQADSRAKSRTPAKKETSSQGNTQAAVAKLTEPAKPAPPKTANLFDVSAPATSPIAASAESEEDSEHFEETDDQVPVEEAEELDDAA